MDIGIKRNSETCHFDAGRSVEPNAHPRSRRVVAVINELLFGGDENRLLTMAKCFDKQRYGLEVVTLRNEVDEGDEKFGSLRKQYAGHGVAIKNLGLRNVNKGLALGDRRRHIRRIQLLARAVKGLMRECRTAKCELISAHTGPGFLTAAVVNAFTGIPYTITTYNVREEWRPLVIWQWVHKQTLRRAAAVITDSDSVAEIVRAETAPRSPRIAVIPNGVDPQNSALSREQARALADIPNDPRVRVIGQVSTLMPTKGQHFLLDAAPAILSRNPHTHFLFVGYTRPDAQEYPQYLKSRAAELGIADHVHFVAYPGPIVDMFACIDIQAHPTQLDSLPQAIIEGMAAGKPCVATAIAGIPTMIESGVTGYVIAPADVEALAARLGELVADDAAVERMGAAAERRHSERYTVAHMASALQNLFDDILPKTEGFNKCEQSS